MDVGILSLLAIVAFAAFMSIKIVPQQQVWIVERMGKYNRSLEAGLNIIVPFIEKIAYTHSLKEKAVDVLEQAAITKDNVTLILDGILYVRTINPVDASYGVDNPLYAVSQLAQTSMRSAIGKMPLDRTFEERETLNNQIVMAINDAASTWGIQCMRYEIKDIKPPATVLKAMELQVAADRQKRAEILESEGRQQAQINIAEADKRSVVLSSEASLTDQVNRARGEAQAIIDVANATAQSIEVIAAAIKKNNGESAIAYKIASDYVQAFEKLAKESNTIVVPSNASDTASMVTQALSIFKSLNHKN